MVLLDIQLSLIFSMKWESEYDCIKQFKKWILSPNNAMNQPICDEKTLETIENDAKIEVKTQSKLAWNEFLKPNKILLCFCFILFVTYLANIIESSKAFSIDFNSLIESLIFFSAM